MNRHAVVHGLRVLLPLAAVAMVASASWCQGAEDDPYQVPQGDAGVLLEFISQLVDSAPPAGSDERQHALKTCRALVAASDQILQGAATDRQVIDAVQFKIEGLTVLEVLGEQEALTRLEKFLIGMADDKRKEIAAYAQEKLVEFRLSQMARGEISGEELDRVVTELVTWMTAAQFDRSRLRTLVRMVEMLEPLGDNKSATAALEQILPHAEKSTVPAVQANMSMLRGIQRRLNLPGNKLELDGHLLDGSKFDWSQYRGKVVLVDFWASWCQFCLEEVPNIKQNYAAYREQGFEVIGVCLDENRAMALDTVERMGISWPTLFSDDESATGWDSPIALHYGISQLPMAILLDREGTVIDMEARGEQLGEQLARLLKEERPARSALAP